MVRIDSLHVMFEWHVIRECFDEQRMQAPP